MSDAVPIDLTPWFDGDDDARDRVAAKVDEACRTVGFLAVTGHRINPDLVDEMLADLDLPASTGDADMASDTADNMAGDPESSNA